MEALDFAIQQDCINHTFTLDTDKDNTQRNDISHSKNNSVNPIIKCPTCHQGYLKYRYTPCGYILACICFPCGIYFCMALKKHECSQCQAQFEI